MYHENFGLTQPPFRNTPDTRTFYPGGKRGAILEALEYAILQGEGIIKVVGEVGSGKTTLCRMLEHRLSGKVETVFIANPSLTPENIFHAIAVELHIPLAEKDDKFQVLQSLQSYLIAKHAGGRHVVVLVEEAQGMPLATLEEIRLLSNLETSSAKLLQLVLFGQPELDINLSVPSIRQLKERISYQFYLPPFSQEDVEEYVIMRMRSAGYRGPTPFTSSASRRIWKLSGGLTRRINLLADKALLAAYIEKKDRVSARHVNQAATESTFTTVRDWRRTTRIASLIALIGVPAAGAVGYFLADYTHPNPPSASQPQKPLPPPLPQTTPQQPVAADEVTQIPSQTNEIPNKPKVEKPAPPVNNNVETTPQSETNTSLVILPVLTQSEEDPRPLPKTAPTTKEGWSVTLPSIPDSNNSTTKPADPPQSAVIRSPIPEAKPLPKVRKETAAKPARSAPDHPTTNDSAPDNKPPAPSKAPNKENFSQFLDRKLAASDQWAKTTDPMHYTLQVMRVNSLEEWFQELASTEETLGGTFFIKPTMTNNQPLYTVYFNDYTSYTKARLDLERLPLKLRHFKPFVQQLGEVTEKR
ncbi:MAG: AAA family ATPase [Magnetococcales bacterium]|nr:AAA family ATPase [Magnetococcales bacterium]